MSSKKEKILGVLFSYVGSAVQIIISLFLPAFLISQLGETPYGIYQMVASFIGNLLLFNFGIATIMSRTVTKSRAEDSNVNKTLYTGIAAAGVITGITIVAALIMIPIMPVVYKDSLDQSQMILANQMYLWLVLSTVLYIWQRMFYGIMIGHEKFAFTNALQFIVQIVRAIVISGLILLTGNVVMITVAEVIVYLIHISVEWIYCRKKLSIRLKIKEFSIDKELLKVAVLFGAASFLQSITRQINNSMDKIILGAKMQPSDVTVYSTGLSLMTAYITLTKLVSNVYLPDATKLVVNKAESKEFEKMMQFPMRIQAIISMAILFGFISIGREFYTVWMGSSYTVMWLPMIMIFVPLSIANLASVPDIILDAKLKKLSRSIALLVMAIINLVVSLLLVDRFGFYGVAFGTAASFLLGNIVIMGFVYIKNIGVNIFRIYVRVSWKSIISGGISCVVSMLAVQVINLGALAKTLLGGLVFAILYAILILITSNKNEKKQIAALKNKIMNKLK